MKRILLTAVWACTLCMTGAIDASAGVIEVEFSEVELRTLTLLDGQGFYAAFGLEFEDETFYAIDDRFIGAGVDDVGITTTTGSNAFMTVVFTTEVTSVTMYFLTLGVTMTGTAFDSNGNQLDDFFFDPGGVNPAYGSETFLGVGPIAKVTFDQPDGAIGLIGVGRLTYTQVPAPATLWLVGAVGLTRRSRRRASNLH